MAGGLHFDSLADLPPSMRIQVAAQMLRHPEPEEPQEKAQKPGKYHSIKTQVAGLKFDSKKEARRFETLQKAVEKGIIYDLRLQRDYTLQEAYTTPTGERIRAIRYKADFTYKVSKDADRIIDTTRMLCLWFNLDDLQYWEARTGYPEEIIEDVKSKGTRTDKYIIKKKLMADLGHDIREV